MAHDTVECNGHRIDAQPFRDALVYWGRHNFRPYPWRTTQDPYQILIAEVMLHRTQAKQVVPIYLRFIERFPNARQLSHAHASELHEMLHSLGLRWRIDLIRDMGSELVRQFDGQVPHERDELVSLPGVSDYIASAVRCFAWNLPEPLIDTNTVRVVGRLFGLPTSSSSRRTRRFRRLITSLLDPVEPRAYNFALLDLAGTVCKSRPRPMCEHCPVASWCQHGQKVVLAGCSTRDNPRMCSQAQPGML